MKFSLHVNFVILPYRNFAALKFRDFAAFACISRVFFACTKFSCALNFHEFVQFTKVAKIKCMLKFHVLQWAHLIQHIASIMVISTELIVCFLPRCLMYIIIFISVHVKRYRMFCDVRCSYDY